jgi:hypothetical protein
MLQLTLSDKNINSCRERKQDENSKKKWTSMLEKQGKKKEVKYRHAWLLFYDLYKSRPGLRYGSPGEKICG